MSDLGTLSSSTTLCSPLERNPRTLLVLQRNSSQACCSFWCLTFPWIIQHCLRKMCLEAAVYCVWGEQWLPPGSCPPAVLPCQVSAPTLCSLPAPKAPEAPALQGAEMGTSPSACPSVLRSREPTQPHRPAAGTGTGWLCPATSTCQLEGERSLWGEMHFGCSTFLVISS